ncbi:SMP-30/gluconolactonase/LRE family protein [Microcella sp.]|uniref:SMP-30/gluconolactonase/LRE family protein n=1 Tax=Microcella sp. TaxID=1913979 RepID=UPI00256DDE97|nr:SMP-30/gluconolactonase/LRE family protein [Microcella sp.]MBX9472011.1 SMP-30/gluconolactonase/LRE family protein [Microcella sp.]
MVTTTAAEQLCAPLAEHGEGPVWSAETSRLQFVDMLAGSIVTIDAGGALVDRRTVGTVAAAFRPRGDGGLVIAVERGFAMLSPDGELTTFAEIWTDPTVRMNDGACDTQGRFLCGTMAYDAAAGRGALHRLELDGSTTTVLEGLTISNGLAFSPDGASAVFVDSPTQQVRRYRLPDDDGPWHDFDVIVEIDPAVGTPDGLCIDSEGGIWVALWGGSAVHRYTADGTLTDIVTVPVRHVTACTLGGDDGRTLFITTSARGVDRVEQPDAGAVFSARVAVTGAPVLPSAL